MVLFNLVNILIVEFILLLRSKIVESLYFLIVFVNFLVLDNNFFEFVVLNNFFDFFRKLVVFIIFEIGNNFVLVCLFLFMWINFLDWRLIYIF